MVTSSLVIHIVRCITFEYALLSLNAHIPLLTDDGEKDTGNYCTHLNPKPKFHKTRTVFLKPNLLKTEIGISMTVYKMNTQSK